MITVNYLTGCRTAGVKHQHHPLGCSSVEEEEVVVLEVVVCAGWGGRGGVAVRPEETGALGACVLFILIDTWPAP
jgi:hypothetical protein